MTVTDYITCLGWTTVALAALIWWASVCWAETKGKGGDE